MGLIGLEVDGRTGRDPDLVADDLEEAGGVVGDRIGVAVARIGIDGRKRGNGRAGRRILIHGAAGQRDVRRGLVDQVVDR